MGEWSLEDRFWNKKHTLECFIMKCTYSGFYISSSKYHYTAYIALPRGHRYYGKNDEKIRLNTHGGWTYSDDTLILPLDKNNEKKNKLKDGRWFIGWDYAHCFDENTTFRQVLFDCLDVMKKLERGM